MPDRKLSHPQRRLTSAHTALTTPVTMMLTGGTMATAALWCQKGGLIYFANVFTSCVGLLLLGLTDIVFMENKLAELLVMQGMLLRIWVLSPSRDMKGDDTV